MTFTDQLHQVIEIRTPPVRIISLVPSQTELLFDLGLEDRVAGITKFCVHPQHWRKSKRIVGGTKNFKLDVIRNLKPDLIIANKEENELAGIAVLQKEFPVWVSDIKDRVGAIEMISQISSITNAESEGEEIIAKIRFEFDNLKKIRPARALYLIWKNPWMAAGNDTFIHAMLSEVGMTNCIEDPRYPILSNERIKLLNPEIILLSSEPFPFSEKHAKELKSILPDSKIILVDGEMFSWYGSRMRLAPAYFSTLSI